MLATRQPRAVRTRENILRAASRLFTLKGYHDTKLEAILSDADVTTGAFFHHFKSKEELAFAVLDWYMEQRRGELQKLADESPPADDDPLGPVMQWLDATENRFRHRAKKKEAGCVYGNLTTALSDTHPAFRRRLADAFELMALDFQPRLDEAAQRCGRRIDTTGLARYIVAVLEGSIILARAHQQPELLARHFDFLKEHLRQVFQGDGQR